MPIQVTPCHLLWRSGWVTGQSMPACAYSPMPFCPHTLEHLHGVWGGVLGDSPPQPSHPTFLPRFYSRCMLRLGSTTYHYYMLLTMSPTPPLPAFPTHGMPLYSAPLYLCPLETNACLYCLPVAAPNQPYPIHTHLPHSAFI